MPTEVEELKALVEKVRALQLPVTVQQRIATQLNRVLRLTGKDYTTEVDSAIRWVEYLASLPWNNRVSGAVDIGRAKTILDTRHYGLQEAKERILEYLAVLKLQQATQSQQPFGNKQLRSPILLLVGLVGTGKTTLAYSIADALGRPVARIPFGGMGSARDLRGQSRLHPEAEPGYILRAMKQVGVKNPIMLLDEIDRVADEARHDIMGVLVELLDPEQNKQFLDHYIDVPFDLSEVLFIATANNTGNIATAVLDRLEPISMPSYSDQEKTIIAKQFLLPKAIEEASLPKGALVIDDDAWPLLVRPLGYDAGIRTLQRTIQHLVRKTAMEIVSGGKTETHITKDNLKDFTASW